MIDKTIIKQLLDNDINITVCKDDFVIIESWDNVEKIETITNKSIDDIFENWGFNDEYNSCDECYNHVEIQPMDKVDYHIFDGSIICGDCIRNINNDYYKDYIQSLINNHHNANTILKDSQLENMGFIKCSCNDKECDFANGLHIGDNDDPQQILKNAIANNPNKEYIFDITNADMFTTNFTIWNRLKQESED